MLQEFEFVGVLSAITLTIPIVTLLIAWALRPKKPNPAKQTTYESGMETIGDAWVQFKAQYYIYAIIYVVFDVEAIFLFPFAVALRQLPLYALVWAVVFIVLLVDGLLYGWRKGALRWN
ncbi:MAG: NADH-quinone oxidoreductase subunit A [Chloroflexi bacterium]|nr:MAG: NADH-quinone oxidoreductase subunit A [Chloroflexota bacterium]